MIQSHSCYRYTSGESCATPIYPFSSRFGDGSPCCLPIKADGGDSSSLFVVPASPGERLRKLTRNPPDFGELSRVEIGTTSGPVEAEPHGQCAPRRSLGASISRLQLGGVKNAKLLKTRFGVFARIAWLGGSQTPRRLRDGFHRSESAATDHSLGCHTDCITS